MATVTRETLYQQVWERPMTTVAKDYGVSSNYLARICEQLNVPRPDRGYWAKRAAGKRTIKAQLPEPDPGDDTVWDRERPSYYQAHHPDVPVYAPTPAVRRRKKRPRTHPLVSGVTDQFKDSKRASYHDDGYLKPKRGELPDIFVSEGCLPRALKFANRLYLALEDRGHWVRSAAKGFGATFAQLEHRLSATKKRQPAYEPEAYRSWHSNRPTLVFIGGVAIGLTVFEVAEDMPAVHEDWSFRRATPGEIRQYQAREEWRISHQSLPSGRLGLFAYSPYPRSKWERYWREEKAGGIGGLLEEILTELESAAPVIVQLEEQGEREAQERDRQYEEAQEKRRLAALEKAMQESQDESRDQLLKVIQGWVTARHVEQFLQELAEVSPQLSEEKRLHLEKRLESARALFGGTKAVDHVRRWKTPDEIFENKKKTLWW